MHEIFKRISDEECVILGKPVSLQAFFTGILKGEQWLSGRVLDLRGRRFEPHWH